MKTIALAPILLLAILTACAPAASFPATSPTLASTLAPTPIGGGSGRLVFSSYRDGESEIYAIDLEGQNVQRITDMADRLRQPVWSPDGDRLAFVLGSNRDQSNLDIVLIDAAQLLSAGQSAEALAAALVQITVHADVDTDPAWSPDGSTLVFASNRDSYLDARGNLVEEVSVFELYSIELDGGPPHRLTFDEAWATAPSWSPDGTRIAFQSTRDGNDDIFVMDLNGGEPVNLSRDPGYDAAPSWSPDGSRIAFHSDREDGNLDLYTMEADGSDVRRLTSNPNWDINPAWSPDSQWLAFYSERDGNFEVYLISANPGAGAFRWLPIPETQIGARRVTVHETFDGFPSWQP